MNILVIAATEAEIRPFLELPPRQRQGMTALVTGVGMVATALALGRQLATTRYDLLLNVGVAGSFDRSIALGEVVQVVTDTFPELGAEDGEGFIDSETMGLAPHSFHSTHAPLSGMRQCRGITVNTVHGNEQTIHTIIKRWAPDTESMEGAAVFQAAQYFLTPAIQVRAISNYVEQRNKANWQLPLAIDNLNRWLTAFTEPPE